MNKGVVAVIAAMALLGCVSGQLLNFAQPFTPAGLATLALAPWAINQLSLPVRPPPPPPFFPGGMAPGMAPYYPPTIIQRTVRHYGGKGGYY